MASVGSYGDYTGYQRPVVHTNPTLYRRTGERKDISKYGYHQNPGSMRTVNAVNMIRSKENISPRDRPDKGLKHSEGQLDDSPTTSPNAKGFKMVDSPRNHNQGVLTQREPHHDRLPVRKSQPDRKMNDNRALVPVKELHSNVPETPRLQSNGSQAKVLHTKEPEQMDTTGSQDGLSTRTKLYVLAKNRQLIYIETVWTKKRIEKLRASGFGDHTLAKKLKSTKEERRWDVIMRRAQQEPRSVTTLWEFIKADFPKLFTPLQKEYQATVRNHFKPRISNLQTTPANANKMLDILVEQSEQHDQRLYELQKSLQDQEDMLEDIRQVLDETRRVVFDWGGREIPEGDEEKELKEMSQQVLDTVVVVSQEKEQIMEQQRKANEELRKKVVKLNKAAKK